MKLNHLQEMYMGKATIKHKVSSHYDIWDPKKLPLVCQLCSDNYTESTRKLLNKEQRKHFDEEFGWKE